MMWRSQKGFSLVEIILAMAICGIVVIATGQLIVMLQSHLRKSQQSSNRMLSIYRLTDRVTDKNAFTASLALSPENDMFRVCSSGGPLNSCVANCCVADVDSEFVLLDPTHIDPLVPLVDRRRLLGTVAKPAYYDAEGELCKVDPSGCSYKVTGTFQARCPAAALSCDKAELFVLDLVISAANASVSVKEKKLKLHFVPESNVPPVILPVANQSLAVGQKLKIPIYGNSGHVQETQDLLFEICETPAPHAIATVTCYGFINGTAYIVIEGVTAGTTTVNLQINDTGTSNFLSPTTSIPVTVTP
jgi:prepilin-type N-terminal cleavage/methylation domain-containing protein